MSQSYPFPSFPRKRESSWLNSFSRITSDFAGVLCQFSRMVSRFISETTSQLCPLRGLIDSLDSRFRGNDALKLMSK